MQQPAVARPRRLMRPSTAWTSCASVHLCPARWRARETTAYRPTPHRPTRLQPRLCPHWLPLPLPLPLPPPPRLHIARSHILAYLHRVASEVRSVVAQMSATALHQLFNQQLAARHTLRSGRAERLDRVRYKHIFYPLWLLSTRESVAAVDHEMRRRMHIARLRAAEKLPDATKCERINQTEVGSSPPHSVPLLLSHPADHTAPLLPLHIHSTHVLTSESDHHEPIAAAAAAAHW